MKFFIFFILLFLIFSLSAQKNELPRYHLQVSAGRCFHGSGDLRGVIFSTDFSKYVKKKLSLGLSLSGTVHDGNYPLYFTYGNQEVDGSLRYTVAGVQLAGLIGYGIVRNEEHEIQIEGGPLLRYQSSSLPDYYEIAYPAATGLPYPVIIYQHSSPQRTYSIGGVLQLHYNYTFSRRFTIGLLAGFQADTEGDNLFQTSLSAGIRL